MKTVIEETVKVTLTLEENEVRWLRGVMQNPFQDIHVTPEDPEDREYRKLFFDALELSH